VKIGQCLTILQLPIEWLLWLIVYTQIFSTVLSTDVCNSPNWHKIYNIDLVESLTLSVERACSIDHWLGKEGADPLLQSPQTNFISPVKNSSCAAGGWINDGTAWELSWLVNDVSNWIEQTTHSATLLPTPPLFTVLICQNKNSHFSLC